MEPARRGGPVANCGPLVAERVGLPGPRPAGPGAAGRGGRTAHAGAPAGAGPRAAAAGAAGTDRRDERGGTRAHRPRATRRPGPDAGGVTLPGTGLANAAGAGARAARDRAGRVGD